jgi:hypothetical protein
LLKREKYRDQKSVDARIEQLKIWSFAILGYELLGAIADRIDTNPFPSERLTLAQIAFRLMPDVKSAVWMAIFSVFELNPTERHYFAASAEEIDIDEVESRLRELLGEREDVPVSEARAAMPWVSTSRTYQSVKRELQERGWLWRSVRREGRVTKIICKP